MRPGGEEGTSRALCQEWLSGSTSLAIHPGNHLPCTSRGSNHRAEGWATMAGPLGGQGQSWSEQAGPSCCPSSCRE